MGIKLGMQMLLEADSVSQNAEWCRDLGLDFVEMHMSLPACQPEALDTVMLRDLMDTYGIFFTLHMPEDMDPAHVSAPVREAWLTLAVEAVEIAQNIGAPILNMHMQSGVHFTLPDRKIRIYERDRDIYLRHMEDFGRRMQDTIGTDGPLICLENTKVYGLSFVCDAIEALLTYPCFGLTWDVGHDRGSGWIAKPFMERHAGDIRHMHLHDGDDVKNHQPLGTGDIDWESALDLARHNGCRVVLEVKTLAGIRQSLERLQKNTPPL